MHVVLSHGFSPFNSTVSLFGFSCLPCEAGNGDKKKERDGLVVGREREIQTNRRDNTEYTGHV